MSCFISKMNKARCSRKLCAEYTSLYFIIFIFCYSSSIQSVMDTLQSNKKPYRRLISDVDWLTHRHFDVHKDLSTEQKVSESY